MRHHCDDCGVDIPPPREPALPGLNVTFRCEPCQRTARIHLMLTACPDEDDYNWEALTEWERDFLPSVRKQVARRGTLTDNQLEALERIYKKV